MKAFLAVIAVFVASTLFAVDASACAVFQPAFSSGYRGDANADLNDYGRIFQDANDPGCAEWALYGLTDKVRNTLDAGPNTFQQWLDGFLVAEIFAAAMRIGANGWAGAGLDEQLARLEGRFQHNITAPSGACGGDEFNTCMDDLVGTASAYAWMAAYQSRRQHRVSQWEVSNTRSLAVSYLQDALAPVTSPYDRGHGICIRMKPVNVGPFTPLCNGTLADLAAGNAETLTVNGQQQLLAYGFGLMTSVATAIHGIEESGGYFYIDSNRQLVARALMEEMQRHVSGGEFMSDCLQKSNGVVTGGAHCGGGPGAYMPYMYRLKPLYDQYFGGITNAGSYDSNYLDTGLFDFGPYAMGHFSYGRYATYGVMASEWIENRPAMMPPDYNEPKGFFEQISSSGLAQGWACDQDMPDGRIKVDFYVDGWSLAAEGWADSGSEPAINWECSGGFAHRFWVQLPPWTQGKDVRAYGVDFTWIGATELPCLQSPSCSW